MSPNTAPDLESTRLRILQAATERFTQYGYNKTTMAEIASDCGMSAANLYRYFENKLAIGSALVCVCLDEKLALITRLVNEEDRSTSERLEQLIVGVLEYSHEQWAAMPHVNELVNAICRECTNIVTPYKQQEHALLVALLQQGSRSGEFRVTDIEQTATAITTVLIPFSHPILMPIFPLDVFRERAQGVASLILSGLKTK